MKKLITSHWLLITIIFLAAFLRLWNLGNIPPHLTNDEAALGYNAYSILKTGRDEYGQTLPLIFRSFGDWKPGLYVYTAVPSIAILGLTEFATRLPGAISGVIAVWLLYLVVGELFRGKNFQFSPQGGIPLRGTIFNFQLIASFLFAISPWHIQFSRGAWEVGLSLTLTLAGIYFFLRAFRDRPRFFILSSLFFGLTLLTYQGAKLSTGIVVLGLVLLYAKEVFSLLPKKFLVSGLAIGLLISLPAVSTLFTGKAGRLTIYSVFSYPRPPEILEGILNQGNEEIKDVSYLIYHSEPLNFARGILGRWMNHYSGRFLFFEGDWSNVRLGVPNAGVLLLIDVVLLVAGIVALVRMKASRGVLFIWFLLLTSPLPAALSRDAIHAIRAFNLVVPLTIIVAAGAAFLWERFKAFSWGKGVLAVFAILYVANFIYWLDQYFVHMPVHDAKSWQYGYKQIVEKITPLQGDYKEIVVAQGYDQPYIYFLFYQKYDPSMYQKTAQLTPAFAGSLDVGLVEKLDNISFEWLDWQQHRGRGGALIIGTPQQIPPVDSSDPGQFKLIGELRYPNGLTAFRIIGVLNE